jgi:hypothetical protein
MTFAWREEIHRRAFLLVAVLAFASSAHAQTWTAVDDPEALMALFGGVVMEGTLAGGAKAVARYSPNGTGVLEAWGDRFERTWKIEGNRICIEVDRQTSCLRIERNDESKDEYRATNVDTGDRLVFTLLPDGRALMLSDPAPGGIVAKPSANEIAADLANPNTPLASLLVKFQIRSFQGDLPGADRQTGTGLLLQPSFPFPRANGDVILFRPAIPIQFDQPVFDVSQLAFDSKAGLGDIAFDLAYARTTKTGLLFAGGLVSTLPTATPDVLGSDRWTLGPELLLGKLAKTYVVGMYPNHQWDVAGSGDADISLTSIQLFGIYLPGGGWNVGSVPILGYDHEAEDWTIPLNVTFGKTLILGGRPWKLGVEVNYFVEQPDAFGPQWLISVNVAPVVENVLANLFK